MGHIDLAAPIVHIWFFKAVGQLLELKQQDVEQIVYYQKHVIIDAGSTGLASGLLLDEEQLCAEREKHGNAFIAQIGAKAIETLLRSLDLKQLSSTLRQQLEGLLERAKPPQVKVKQLCARLRTVEWLRDSENRPEWLVYPRLPVIPPDLRPINLLPSGKYASSSINELYRRLIEQNLKLKKLIRIHAPTDILREEKRILQEYADALIDNSSQRGFCRSSGRGKPRKLGKKPARNIMSIERALRLVREYNLSVDYGPDKPTPGDVCRG